jgi:hypothetical protein
MSALEEALGAEDCFLKLFLSLFQKTVYITATNEQ